MAQDLEFGSAVFSKKVMKERLSPEVYQQFIECTHTGGTINPVIAEQVAWAMKNWAIEKGATHFTHWFQPLTGITAGKFDAFMEPDGEGGAISEFSSGSLFKGEPDASSFPTGGLRATFEARGYTAWDPTSPAFVKGDALYIPTAFCSYTGEALDTKTPLLRSMEAVSKEATRLCHAIGMNDVKRVDAMTGAEQEYFLVDREKYEKRLDLKICGRTLIGTRPLKGQELDDHYFGRIRIKIDKYMKEVDRRLWELGVPSKTKHNEAAPAQHELAPVYTSCNVACDHNQLIMETLRTVAKENGLACLLHEKPFKGINGSGKHNNYSLVTDTGINLFKQGKNPKDDPLFIISLCAFIRAVDKYAELLRMSAAGPTNDIRLGGNEAPPDIVSLFLGTHLLNVLKDIAKDNTEEDTVQELFDIGVPTSPQLKKDDSDRNRTSPVAFTGNKFEFRMVGSSQSVAMSSTVLNTIMADSFGAFADYFVDFGFDHQSLAHVVDETLRSHGRIIFNGNNYAKEWFEEAEKRGLPIIHDSVEAFGAFLQRKNIELFKKYSVLSPVECRSRYEIMLEYYNKVVYIEATTLCEMIHKQIVPSLIEYIGRVAKSANGYETAMGEKQQYMIKHLRELSTLLDSIVKRTSVLENILSEQPTDEIERAVYMRDDVIAAMESVRESCDNAEIITDERYWPIPDYTDLLHKV